MTQTIAPPISELSVAATDPRTGPIIVAVDGADSRSVLRAARLLAPCVSAGVLAVSVFEPPATCTVAGEMSFEPPSRSAMERAELAASLIEQVEECVGPDETWRTTVLDGDPPHALAELARTLDSPLIVMGMGQHRPAGPIAGVETCLRTIQRAPCAVLALHADVDGIFHDVVLATDFSPESAHAGKIVLSLLSDSATLHLVHVRESAASASILRTAAADARAVRLADQFRRLVGVLSAPHGVTVTSATLEGKAAEQIVTYANWHRADLIVAGRRSFNALKRMFVGSVTTDVLRGANCSVFVTPEPTFRETDRLRIALTGTSFSNDPAEWAVLLASFTGRNSGRQVSVTEEEIARAGAVEESGFVLLGVAYDPRPSNIELILGDCEHAARRVRRTIGAVDSVTVTAAPTGEDAGLRISHGGGLTVLTFPGK